MYDDPKYAMTDINEPELRTCSSPPWGVLAFVYVVLVIYGSLYPFAEWGRRTPTSFDFLRPMWPSHVSRVDLVTNILAYVPLGLMLVLRTRQRRSDLGQVVFATLVGALLSMAVEFLQQFLPSRVASIADVITNVIGTLAGALLAAFVRMDSAPGRVWAKTRNRFFLPRQLTDLGLVAIGLWALSHLTPLVPSFDIGNLRQGVAPIWRTFQHPGQFNPVQAATYFFYIAGLALLARTLGKPDQPVGALFFAFVAAVLLLKIPIITRQLSLEAIAGVIVAAVILLPIWASSTRVHAFVAAFFILSGFAVSELSVDATDVRHSFNWVPFRGQLENTLIGFASILESIWPAAALAYLARCASTPRIRSHVAWGGGLALALIVFVLEWHQQFIAGRYGDATIVVLMAATWALFWSISKDDEGSLIPEQGVFAERCKPIGARLTQAGTLAVAAVIGVGSVVAGQHPVEIRVDESKLAKLPAPQDLPPASLPGFRVVHPRLPAPTVAQLSILRGANPEFFRDVRARAGGGEGDLGMVTLQGVIEPGSVDIDLLYRKLMALQFSGRGHEQAKPLAVAYDWLYPLWNESQRVQLRGKLAEACDYIIEGIRKARMSPYNVILYNAPLQGLMACALALFGDDPRGDPIMRFTFDLWKKRVLPVWRQIMGRNGGWHEGGEYVGVGIGQAIYELPAMWRSATGEDLIATEPGIRGFLDFLVYRTRPDETHFRWGDGGFFDRPVPDAIPLAIELGHSAAYSLRPPPRLMVPSGWPWGPLTDVFLYDPKARAQLAPTRYFDGVGMIVARTDWSPDATYVTFKAGDNYWSHVHLDQGAFTIYKGGELAIDSGLYGPKYGSAHHMNYSYQTIAHNTITVTDPNDDVPAPNKKDPRPIANDGGQRRIGSGWGIEAAPIDLEEWEAKRDIYHTATMEQVFDGDGLTVAVADVTPAYTNAQSGMGTFSHRTRRVERFWRVFAYDRIDDAVVVFDQVTATRASFRKRWLLHTQEEPSVRDAQFSVSVSPQNRPGHAGGRLEGIVLLPKDAQIVPIGGPDLEFFVDNKNYDESGALRAMINSFGPNRNEPGAWRLEVSPLQDAATDNFLVVLLPTLAGVRPNHRVRLLEAGQRVGCEVVGPARTTRWWFEPGRNGVEMELEEGGTTKRHSVFAPLPAVTVDSGWFSRMREWFQ